LQTSQMQIIVTTYYAKKTTRYIIMQESSFFNYLILIQVFKGRIKLASGALLKRKTEEVGVAVLS